MQALYTDKKENQILLIYKEIQSEAVAKSLVIYDFATSILNFLIYEENLIFFLSVYLLTHLFQNKTFALTGFYNA